jgi:DNA repair protein RadC
VPVPRAGYHAVLAVKACAREAPGAQARSRAALTAALRRAVGGGRRHFRRRFTLPKRKFNMNDVSSPDCIPTVTSRPATVRTYRTALSEPGACRLTPEELAIVTQALVILENRVMRKLKPEEILKNPARVKQWLILHYGMLDREVFGLIFLDARYRYLGHQQLFTGDIQGASVHPRQVARSVFEFNAAAVIACHCHPSHVAEQSQADELITARLKELLSQLDVRLVDHLIVGGNQVMSFAERGLL